MIQKKFLDRALIESERLDAIRQRDEAQQQLNAAAQQIHAGQQLQQQAQSKLLIAEGMVQQNDAYLKKLETLDASSTPSP